MARAGRRLVWDTSLGVGVGLLLCFGVFPGSSLAVFPGELTDQFELEPGFRIFRVATGELCGGSYDIAFDGEGRLLVADGTAVRRLQDGNQDGFFDAFEVVANDLGWRGPQGLLVEGNRLLAVGGDGIQLFEEDARGAYVHRRRLGNRLNTGGDHDAHTLMRGIDGYLYFITGDGGGTTNRQHITEEASPVRYARNASVFRISPDGARWECIGTGGRNPPNLGMHTSGDWFSLDSDMEWHIGLPWYRPVRLNHWAIGSDHGWQEVGAYPPYFIDNVGGVLEIGRGSPAWGVFYEHDQFPADNQDAFFVGDYSWKRASADEYETTGRLLRFGLRPSGAGWKATMKVFAQPRPGARDVSGKPIGFSLVDVEVAPDGSLFLSDHNQGLWRIIYDPTGKRTLRAAALPALAWEGLSPAGLRALLLELPQPGAEWSRRIALRIQEKTGSQWREALAQFALERTNELDQRLRALRHLAPHFAELPLKFYESLARDPEETVRGQAAFLLGLEPFPASDRGANEGAPAGPGAYAEARMKQLLSLLRDEKPGVRRRAVESLARVRATPALRPLIAALADEERLIRFLAMNALSHYPLADWWERAARHQDPRIVMRALVASRLRREPPPVFQIHAAINRLLPYFAARRAGVGDELDFLRVLSLFREEIQKWPSLTGQVENYVIQYFPRPSPAVRWEEARLLQEYGVDGAFPSLAAELEKEPDPVTQFHLAQQLSALDVRPGTDAEPLAVDWFVGAQRGWFADLNSKGAEFPHFWVTVLMAFASRHPEAVFGARDRIELDTLLGSVLIDLVTDQRGGFDQLGRWYREAASPSVRQKIMGTLRKLSDPRIPDFLRQEYRSELPVALRGTILRALADRSTARDAGLVQEGLAFPDYETARECARALARHPPPATAGLVQSLITRMTRRPDVFPEFHHLLVALAGDEPAQFPHSNPPRDPTGAERVPTLDYWKEWYRHKFGAAFMATAQPEKSDEELHQFFVTVRAEEGDPRRGAKIYEQAQCHTCHGGGTTPGREGRFFGPDLAGVTRRLTRAELAEAIVYPSRRVADRFQGHEFELKDGTVLSGFVTDQKEREITVIAREEVRRIPRDQIRASRPQSGSFMPDHLLNAFTQEQLRDLFAFLDQGVPLKPAAR